MYYYLILNLVSLAFPLGASFDKRFKYFSKWKYLFPSIIITGTFFIVWDVYFTKWGIWGFNPKYLTGPHFFGLPIEEWMFFIFIPFSCVFIYESVNYFFPKPVNDKLTSWVSGLLVLFLLIVGGLNNEKAYTFITFMSLAAFIMVNVFILKSSFLGKFYLAYLFVLIPFFLVNGALTGAFTDEPVVWYNDNENLGIRMYTIPVEDTFYGMLLILMNTTFYELFRGKNSSPSQSGVDKS